MRIEQKYASLLVNYCLSIKQGDSVFINSTYLAKPLIDAVVQEIYNVGGKVAVSIEYSGRYTPVKDGFDFYLTIHAPCAVSDGFPAQINMNFTRRCLCAYPTPSGAAAANMSLDEYARFVYQACFLFDTDPIEKWKALSLQQQQYVDYLNNVELMQYRGHNMDITFSTNGRIWINSNGTTNMPSGEVFSAPIENSINGKAYFNYPVMYQGMEISGITLEVKDGQVINWSAERGGKVLDYVFSIDGSRRFGEVAIGNNYGIKRFTRNILFDEKIGGSIHMAIGASYKKCGGENNCNLHLDMIADMKKGGQVLADDIVIYQNGVFVI